MMEKNGVGEAAKIDGGSLAPEFNLNVACASESLSAIPFGKESCYYFLTTLVLVTPPS